MVALHMELVAAKRHLSALPLSAALAGSPVLPPECPPCSRRAHVLLASAGLLSPDSWGPGLGQRVALHVLVGSASGVCVLLDTLSLYGPVWALPPALRLLALVLLELEVAEAAW